MKRKSFVITIVLLTLVGLLSSCNSGKKESLSLSGAGATFPEPFYTMAFSSYQDASKNTVAYGGIGSGGGIRNLKDQIVDFAGSDAFLSDKEMESMKPIVHVPTCMGAVVLAYNLPNVKQLRLTGELIADIFSGKITKWNDNRLAAINPDVTLPDKNIIPVFRSDGSGTTFVFTTYLSQVSDTWKENFGASKSVDFPVGQAAKGNPGIAGIVSQTPYAIGYLGSEYAFAQRIPMATLANASGKLVNPTIKSISAAAKGNLPTDTRTMITNSDNPDAYPISCFTWLIIYKEQNYGGRTKEQALATVELLQYMLSEQIQESAATVNYAPLPKSAIKNSLSNLRKVTYNGISLLAAE